MKQITSRLSYRLGKLWLFAMMLAVFSLSGGSGNAQTCDLVVNGNFSIGGCPQGSFTSDYSCKPSSPMAGTGRYAVTNNPAGWNGDLWRAADRLGGTNFLITDGANSVTTATPRLWVQTVSVVAGQQYRFTTWVKNIVNPTGRAASLEGSSVPAVGLRINNALLISSGPLSRGAANAWTQLTTTYTATTTGNISLTIILQLTGVFNDVGIDDISFVPVIPAPKVTNGSACKGQSAILTATGAAGSDTYVWYNAPSGGSIVGTGSSFATPALNGTTTYWVAIRTAAGCTGSRVAVQATQTTIQAPQVVTQGVCSGSTGKLTANAPGTNNTYEWYTSETGTTPVFTGNPFITPILTYNITYWALVKNSQGCNSGRTEATIVITPLPSQPTTRTQTICPGSSATLSATGGNSVEWYNAATGGSIVSTSNSFVTPPLTASTTYWVSAKNNSGCLSVRKAVTVNVFPSAPLPVINNVSVCTGSSATLQVVNAPADVLYEWYNSENSTNPFYVGRSYATPLLTATTTYWVTSRLAQNACRSKRVAVTVTVNPIPVVPIVPNQTVCAGAAATFKVTSPVASSTYFWYASANSTTTIATGPTFTTPALTSSISYWVSQRSASGCVSARRKVNATVVPIPARPDAINNQTICGPGTVILRVNPFPPNQFNYVWYNTLNATTPVFTGNPYTVAVQNTTSFWVAAINAQGCESSRRQVNVTVTPTTPSPVANDASRCGCGTLLLTASGVAGQYNWYTSATSTTPVGNGTSFTTPVLCTNTTYWVSVTGSGTCASKRIPVAANVSAVELVTNGSFSLPNSCPQTTFTSDYMCDVTPDLGGPGWFTVTNNPAPWNRNYWRATDHTGGTNFLIADGGTAPNTRIWNQSVNVVAGQQYYFSAWVKNIVDPTSNAGNESSLPSVSLRVNTTTLVTSPGLAQTAIDDWTPLSATYTATTTGTVSLNVFQLLTGSYNDIAVDDISFSPLAPTPAAANQMVCSGSTATLTATGGFAGYTYLWYTSATGGTPVFTGNPYTTPVLTESKSLWVALRAADGCIGTRTEVNITVNPLPETPTVSDVSICANTAATLTANGAGTSLWYDTETNATPVFTGNPYVTPALSTATTYWVAQRLGTGCISKRAAVNVTVSPVSAKPTVANATVCINSTASLLALGAGATLWYTSATGTSPVFMGNPFVTPELTANTSYWVSLHAAGACESERVKVEVTVTPSPVDPRVTNGQRCGCGPVTLSVAGDEGTYNWYDQGTGGVVIGTGNTFTTPSICTTTNYWVAVTNAAGCTSGTVMATAAVTTSSQNLVVNGNFAAPHSCQQLSFTSDYQCDPTPDINGEGHIAVTNNAPLWNGPWWGLDRTGSGTNFLVADGTSSGDSRIWIQNVNVVAGQQYTFSLWARNIVNPNSGAGNDFALPTVSIRVNNTVVATTPDLAQTAPTVWTFLTGTYTATTTGPVTLDVLQNIVAGYNDIAIDDINFSGSALVAPSVTHVTSCSNTSSTLTATGAVAGDAYVWYTSATDTTPLFIGNPFVTPVLDATTTYWVSVRNASGCESDRIYANVTIEQTPLWQSSSNPARCECGSQTLGAYFDSGTIRWYDALSGGQFVGTGNEFITPTLCFTTAYYASAISANGCESERRPSYATFTRPTASTQGPDVVKVNTPVQITLTISNDTGEQMYAFAKLLPGGFVLDADQPNPSPSVPFFIPANGAPITVNYNGHFTNAGNVPVCFDVTSNWCTANTCKTINVLPCGITTDTLPSRFLCAGNATKVSFEAEACANFQPDNVFTAQLSDANGNWDHPVNIGSIASASASPINAIIPIGTSLGWAYKVRVVSSNPYLIGSETTLNNEISQCNRALAFYGDDRVTIPHHDAYNVGSGDFTLEALVQIPVDVTSRVPVFSKRTTGFDGFLLYSYGTRLLLQMNGVPNYQSNNFANINDGNCHHIAVTRSGTAVTFYVDGTVVGSAVSSRGLNSPGPLYIGYDSYDNSHFSGTINEARFWSVARTSAELTAHATASLEEPSVGLIGLWKFNEVAVEQVVIDNSQVANHGYLGTDVIVDNSDPLRSTVQCYSADRHDAPSISKVYNSESGLNITATPNPFTEQTVISVNAAIGTTYRVEVYNMHGLLVLTEDRTSSNELVLGNELTPGMYFVKVTENGVSQTVKIIKE